jgi:hypothetical protein
MDPCPTTKNGRHDLSAVIPGEDTGDITLFCDRCGAIRRVPVSGALGVPLDDMSAAAIARETRRG